MENIEELEGSELGTKEYWEKSYELEIKNYVSHGDVGEVWFDESSQFRIIKWMLKTPSISKDDAFIDLGCGNGMMLIEVAREGFTNLTGIDYSPKAVELAQKIAADQEIHINYKQVDLISEVEMTALGNFQIVHDKGTYDAISLMIDNPKENREKYLKNVAQLMTNTSIFVITSCNWTQPELIASFKDFFTLESVIPTPTFNFGGSSGNIVTSLVFKKNQ